VTFTGVFSTMRSSSIIGRSVGSETTMTSALPSRRVRDEPVTEHQVGRDRPEQLLVDPEFVHVDELDVIALRELPRAGDFLGVILRGGNEVRLIRLIDSSPLHPYHCTTELSSNSGMYSASTTSAIHGAHHDENHRLDSA